MMSMTVPIGTHRDKYCYLTWNDRGSASCLNDEVRTSVYQWRHAKETMIIHFKMSAMPVIFQGIKMMMIIILYWPLFIEFLWNLWHLFDYLWVFENNNP